MLVASTYLLLYEKKYFLLSHMHLTLTSLKPGTDQPSVHDGRAAQWSGSIFFRAARPARTDS